MAQTKSNRLQAIETALASVYLRDGQKIKNTMVESLAADVDNNWEAMQDTEYREFEQELTNRIWNWYSGGGTAAIAAERVIKAVEAVNE